MTYKGISSIANQIRNEMNDLQSKDYNEWFRYPVDDAIAPEYSLKIKHPMCFSLIHQRLNSKEYEFTSEVKFDVDLIWNNCQLYNDKPSITDTSETNLYIFSELLQSDFNKKWTILSKEWIDDKHQKRKKKNKYENEQKQKQKNRRKDKKKKHKKKKKKKMFVFIKLYKFLCMFFKQKSREIFHGFKKYQNI